MFFCPVISTIVLFNFIFIILIFIFARFILFVFLFIFVAFILFARFSLRHFIVVGLGVMRHHTIGKIAPTLRPSPLAFVLYADRERASVSCLSFPHQLSGLPSPRCLISSLEILIAVV